jgi:hypothetical protein
MPDCPSLACAKVLADVAKQSGTGGVETNPNGTLKMTTQQPLEQIARQHLGLTTLTTRNADSLDFHDLAVWSIEAALKAAFEAGQQAAGHGAKGGAA